MKKIIGIASAVAGVAVLIGAAYILYKKFCPC